MHAYHAPLRDIRFVVEELLLAFDTYADLPAYREIDAQLFEQTITELATFSERVIAPLNAAGDLIGCHLREGGVVTPPGFADAYRQYVDAGWPTLGCDVQHGGQGFPALAHSIAVELLSGANHAWAMYPLLSHGIYKILSRHAGASLRERYLPKIVSGEWTTTMCLTEPQCGSDLALLRTRAHPDPSESLADAQAFRLTGTKMFISGGDQDWTDNIVHLVLARFPDAPPGVKGISLFLVPKVLTGDTDDAGTSNGVTVTALEHKMGLRGSATCALAFDGAVGWLVGQPHQGLAAMFILMNEARLNVGVQALAVAQGAYDAAVAYARERLQMRASSAPSRPELPADPIIYHADVRRMLLTQKARIEGGRMLAYWMALCSDIESSHPDASRRREAAGRLALLTPVTKAFLSDNAFDDANLAMQVFGGHGYLRDHGLEQRVRDVRITQIYEGTNGIQARDLLARRILGDGGAQLRSLLDDVVQFVESLAAESRLVDLTHAVTRLADEFGALIGELSREHATTPEHADAAAYDVLQALGYLLQGYLFLRAARIVLDRADDADRFYAAKLATARFYIQSLMPRAFAHLSAARANGRAVLSLPVDCF